MLKEQVADTRLVTHDSFTDGLRGRVIPLWETLYTYQKNELRILCDEQRKLTTKEILNLFKAEIDKLTVIDATDIYKQFCSSGLSGGVSLAEYLTQAQLQDTKKQLLDGLEEGED